MVSADLNKQNGKNGKYRSLLTDCQKMISTDLYELNGKKMVSTDLYKQNSKNGKYRSLLTDCQKMVSTDLYELNGKKW